MKQIRGDLSAFRKRWDVDETIEPRAGEAFDVTRLAAYLAGRLPDFDGALTVRQFGGGHANLTYELAYGDRRYVLRRPPVGPLPRGGHDMQREFTVLSALQPAFALAPHAVLFCGDEAIIGAPFLIMERRYGIAIRQTLPAALAGDPAGCARLASRFIETLVDLHRVDYAAIGLGDLGRPNGFLRRQVTGWIERWERAKTPDAPTIDALTTELVASLPSSHATTLVHNDYKFDNMLFDANDPTEPVALLDWDMCTIGDPLVDLGNILALWLEPGESDATSASLMPTAFDGFPRRTEVVAAYATRTGFDCARIRWYHAFNIFRYAAIAQQIYLRYRRGQTNDPRFAGFAAYVRALVARAESLADRGL